MEFEDRAIEAFLAKAKDKYLKGKAEHGQGVDDLDMNQIVEELEGELIDLMFYYYGLKEKMTLLNEAYSKLNTINS